MNNEIQQQKRGRMILIGIVLIFVLPLIAAYWLLSAAEKGGVWGTTHHGVLVQPPRALQPFSARTADGTAMTLDNVKGIWTLAYMPAMDCLDACKQALYHMRQVRLALGREAPRVQEWLLPAAGINLSQEVVAEHPQIKVLPAADVLTSQLAHEADPRRTGLYLIDPLGNFMMLFPANTDPRDILKDLKKLLRISRVG
jgi:cytochrome oxidase Cu insertion factor (SCO1/SenC/PrrC family)